jgi:hypothetical protein
MTAAAAAIADMLEDILSEDQSAYFPELDDFGAFSPHTLSADASPYDAVYTARGETAKGRSRETPDGKVGAYDDALQQAVRARGPLAHLIMRSRELRPFVSPQTGELIRAMRSYHAASHLQVYIDTLAKPADQLNDYEMIQEGEPCHFFWDFDNTQPDRHRNVAMKVFLHYVRRAWSLWGFPPARAVTSRAYAPGKQSEHCTLIMDGLAMFRDIHEVRKAVQCILQQSVLELGFEHNPLFCAEKKLEHKAACYKPLIDCGVYTPRRNFRFLGHSKAKPAGTPLAKFYPLKRLCRGAPHCASPFVEPDAFADPPQQPRYCPCMDFSQVTLEMFLAHMITYRPRDGLTGLPLPITAVVVPENQARWDAARALLTKEGTRGGAAGAAAATGFKRPAPAMAAAAAAEPDAESEPAIMKGVRVLARLVARKLGKYEPEIVRVAEQGKVILQTPLQECMYRKEQTGFGKHDSNHVYIVARLDYPYPRLTWRCHNDKICQPSPRYASRQFFEVNLGAINPEKFWAEYTAAFDKIMGECTFSTDELRACLKAAGDDSKSDPYIDV